MTRPALISQPHFQSAMVDVLVVHHPHRKSNAMTRLLYPVVFGANKALRENLRKP
jgi:hypothetical protein